MLRSQQFVLKFELIERFFEITSWRMINMRSLLPTDTERIASIYFPFIQNTAVSFETECPSVAVFGERLQSIAGKFPFLVLEENNSILGYAYATTHRERLAYRWAVETSIYMAENARGRGLAKPLYMALLEELQKRHFTHAFGIITLPNQASEKLHASCGFETIGVHAAAGYKLDKWHDVLWMRKSLAPETELPQEPYFGPFTFSG